MEMVQRMGTMGNDYRKILEFKDEHSLFSGSANATGDSSRNSNVEGQLHPHAIHLRSVIK